jgi:hypothetical protein
MANVLGPKVWKIDTAAELIAERRIINRIQFVPGAVGDSVVVNERNGNLIWEHLSAFAGGTVGSAVFDIPFDADGITVDSISSGSVLYIWLKKT